VTPDLTDRQRQAPVSSSPSANSESTELEQVRDERDAALEELAFLREQLQGTEAFYAHRFELEFRALYEDHQRFLEGLTQLSAAFHRRLRQENPVRDNPEVSSGPADSTITQS
jgi:hypothetical protein